MPDPSKQLQASCPCCGFATLTDFTYWSYEICPVCFWENDPIQGQDASYTGGANRISLLEARENFARIGACCPEAVSHVRSPRLDEMPFPKMLNGLDQEQRTAAVRLRKAQMLTVIRGVCERAIPCLDGSCIIAMLASGLSESEGRTDLLTFEVIAGELDEFPRGPVRDMWSPDALARKDAEWREYERRMNDEIKAACQSAQQRLEHELNSN